MFAHFLNISCNSANIELEYQDVDAEDRKTRAGLLVITLQLIYPEVSLSQIRRHENSEPDIEILEKPSFSASV